MGMKGNLIFPPSYYIMQEKNAFLEFSNASSSKIKKSKMYQKVDKIVGEC